LAIAAVLDELHLNHAREAKTSKDLARGLHQIRQVDRLHEAAAQPKVDRELTCPPGGHGADHSTSFGESDHGILRLRGDQLLDHNSVRRHVPRCEAIGIYKLPHVVGAERFAAKLGLQRDRDLGLDDGREIDRQELQGPRVLRIPGSRMRNVGVIRNLVQQPLVTRPPQRFPWLRDQAVGGRKKPRAPRYRLQRIVLHRPQEPAAEAVSSSERDQELDEVMPGHGAFPLVAPERVAGEPCGPGDVVHDRNWNTAPAQAARDTQRLEVAAEKERPGHVGRHRSV
jgi:hypothetical protein